METEDELGLLFVYFLAAREGNDDTLRRLLSFLGGRPDHHIATPTDAVRWVLGPPDECRRWQMHQDENKPQGARAEAGCDDAQENFRYVVESAVESGIFTPEALGFRGRLALMCAWSLASQTAPV